MRQFLKLLGAYLLIFFALTGASTGRASDHDISKADYFVEGLAPVRKDGPYDLTIVYFMDYQCPACRQYTPDVARVLKEDRRIRVIYRDTPLLGPRSDEAARAAIASSFQGRHEPFHHALMTTKGPLDESAIKAAARKAGVNWPRLQRDMISRREDIDLLIGRNVELATLVGIAGTPAFIIGERQSNGALDYQSLKLEIADARKELGLVQKPSDARAQTDSVTKIPPGQAFEAQSRDDATPQPNVAPVVNLERQERRASDVNSNAEREGAWKWWAAMIVGLFVFGAIWAAKRKMPRDPLK